MTDSGSVTHTARRTAMIDFWREAHERIMQTEVVSTPTGRLWTNEYRERLVAEVAEASEPGLIRIPNLTIENLSTRLVARWVEADGVPKAKLMRIRREMTVFDAQGPYRVVVSPPRMCWPGLAWRAGVPFPAFRDWVAERRDDGTRVGRLALALERERERCALVAEWPDQFWSHLKLHGPAPAFVAAFNDVVKAYRAEIRERSTQAALTTQGD